MHPEVASRAQPMRLPDLDAVGFTAQPTGLPELDAAAVRAQPTKPPVNAPVNREAARAR